MTQREYSYQLWCGSVVRCLKEVKILHQNHLKFDVSQLLHECSP
jgi:hypothetical protein